MPYAHSSQVSRVKKESWKSRRPIGLHQYELRRGGGGGRVKVCYLSWIGMCNGQIRLNDLLGTILAVGIIIVAT